MTPMKRKPRHYPPGDFWPVVRINGRYYQGPKMREVLHKKQK